MISSIQWVTMNGVILGILTLSLTCTCLCASSHSLRSDKDLTGNSFNVLTSQKCPWNGIIPRTISIWINSSDHVAHEYIFLRTPMTWEAAYTSCDDVGATLVTKNAVTDDVWKLMKNNTFYWVGAVETFSPWTWTEDNTTLFEHIEDLDAAVYATTIYRSLRNNSAFSCYQLCNTRRVGLQGQRCYCSVPNFGIAGSIRDDNVRCPGTYDEYCGGEHTLSIYKLALPESTLFVHDDTESHNCAYIYSDDNGVHLAFHDCDTFKANRVCDAQSFDSNIICDGNMCVSNSWKKQTWQDSRQSCSNKLSKLTTKTAQSLRTLLSGKQGKYWVGLHREREWRWIDGSRDRGIRHNTDTNDCLTWLTDATHKHWYTPTDCQSSNFAVCQVHATSSSTLTTTSTTTPMLVKVSSSPGSRITSMTTLNISTVSREINRMRQTNDNSSTGLSVGIEITLGVLVVIVIVSVIAVVWMKRRKRLCFKQKHEFETSLHCRYRANPTTISMPLDNPNYCIDNMSDEKFNQEAQRVLKEIAHALKQHEASEDDAIYQNLNEVHCVGDNTNISNTNVDNDKPNRADNGSPMRFNEKYDKLSTMPHSRASISHVSMYHHLAGGNTSDGEIYDVISDHRFPKYVADDYNRIRRHTIDCSVMPQYDDDEYRHRVNDTVTSQCNDDECVHRRDEDDDVYYFLDNDDYTWGSDSEFSNCDLTSEPGDDVEQDVEQDFKQDEQTDAQEDSPLPHIIIESCTHC